MTPFRNRASAESEFLDALVKREPKLAPKFAAEKAQEQVRRAAREFDQDVGRNLGIEQRRLLRAIKSKWGGVEFFAGDTFSMIRDGYLEWFRAEAQRKNMYCANVRETATLELLEPLRQQELLTKRVEVRNEYGDEAWYYTLTSKGLSAAVG
jgi:hypothetical protein